MTDVPNTVDAGSHASELPSLPDLDAMTWSLVEQIPRGAVGTYGSIARALGDVAASRYVGRLLLHHRHDRLCRCHRVVMSNGSLGKFVTGETKHKQQLLAAEGVSISRGKLNLSAHEFDEWCSSQPLTRLAHFQEATARCVHLDTIQVNDARVGGVDISYVPKSDLAVGAFVVCNLDSGEVEFERTLSRPIRFPYISSYLAFRELPLLVELCQQVQSEDTMPNITLVDGSGRLHPRRAGIASMLGVLADMPTIGVTKKHLAGRRVGQDSNAPQEVQLDGEISGYALPSDQRGRRLYLSPGHRADPSTALDLVLACMKGRKLPDPIYHADRISRRRARQLAPS